MIQQGFFYEINMGLLDQLLRIGISLLLLYVGFIDETLIKDSLSSNVIGIMGTVGLFLALLRFCPLYLLFGITTCSYKDEGY
mgnify:CR=1 FL=1